MEKRYVKKRCDTKMEYEIVTDETKLDVLMNVKNSVGAASFFLAGIYADKLIPALLLVAIGAIALSVRFEETED